MRKKSRRYQHESLFNSITCNNDSDKNRIFSIRQCIIYTGRLMYCLPILDQETLDFIQWLIPEEDENIVKLVIGMLSKKDKDYFSDEILQCTENPVTYPQEIDIITESFTRGKIQRLVDQILLILEQKCNQLQYQGSSELEIGMASLKTMFNLTDGEEKLCWLFFICAKWKAGYRKDNIFVWAGASFKASRPSDYPGREQHGIESPQRHYRLPEYDQSGRWLSCYRR